MPFIKGLIKAGIAKKVYDEARKPHNQRKAKELFAQLRDKKAGGPKGGRLGRR